MLDVTNPDIPLDEIMQRIHEKVRARRERTSPARNAPTITELNAGAPASPAVEELFVRAEGSAHVGAALPPMTRLHGVKRKAASAIGRIFLRVAQLITRDQRTFNVAALDLLRELAGEAARLRTECFSLRREMVASLEAAETRSREEAASNATKIAQLRTAMSLQEHRLSSLAEGDKPSASALPVRSAALESPSEVLDATYLAFEDQFRGSREEIKKRLAVYLPVLRGAQAGTEQAPVLDLGCGRGEMLELLRENGLTGFGVDTNRGAVEQCQALGLRVEAGDAFDFLRKISNATLGAVAAIHFVEHLPSGLVFQLIDECLRVVRPGGLVIFETPNPRNILVGACNFYLDITHRNPIHPQTLQYLLEARGMFSVETMQLHPCAAELHVPEDGSILARRFNEYFYGPQDYAVVGRRP
jgi:SAM-dependent methyltransferase